MAWSGQVRAEQAYSSSISYAATPCWRYGSLLQTRWPQHTLTRVSHHEHPRCGVLWRGVVWCAVVWCGLVCLWSTCHQTSHRCGLSRLGTLLVVQVVVALLRVVVGCVKLCGAMLVVFAIVWAVSAGVVQTVRTRGGTYVHTAARFQPSRYPPSR